MSRPTLKRSIGKITLLFLTINAILGTGIFFLPAIGAGYAGPASLISWIITALIAIFMASYFAELVSMFPKSGGVYEYTKKAFGELTGFIVGWTTWILTNITIGMLIIGSLYYLLPGSSFYIYIPLSILIILIFNAISYRGVNVSAKVLLGFGIITVGVLVALIIPGIVNIDLANFQPFFTHPMPFILLAVFFLIETFIGWETTTFFAEEVKNVRKVMPKILIWATLIIVILAIVLVFVSLGVVHWSNFSQADAPLSYLAQQLFSPGVAYALTLIMFVPLIGAVAGWIIASPRLLFAMSRDKVLPVSFSKLHSKYHTPHNAIIFQTIVSIIITMVGFGSYVILLSLLLPLVLISYSSVMLSVLKLRISKPDIKRYFRAPLGKISPVILLFVSGWLIIQWITTVPGSWWLFLLDMILVFLGFPLYILVKLQVDENFIEKFFDRLSWFWSKSFPLWYGKREARKVISKMNIKKGDKILDFGCGTGITTLELAKKVGDNGTVVAVDLSKKQLEKASQKISQTKLSNVIFIKQRSLTPFSPKSFDSVTAVGVLEHFHDPQKMIKDILKFLKIGGCFSFMSFGKSMGIPASEFLHNERSIKKLFNKIGYDVKVKKEKKKFTEYWYIYGKNPKKKAFLKTKGKKRR